MRPSVTTAENEGWTARREEIRLAKATDPRLARIAQQLAAMGHEVLARLRRTLAALDPLDVQTAPQLIEADARTDQQEVAIERACIDLLSGRQGAVTEPDTVTAIIKANADLERIADLTVNIAERIGHMAQVCGARPPDQIRQMGRIACEMLTDVLDAFGRRDVVLAERVLQRDDAVDVLNEEMYRHMLAEIADDPDRLECAMHDLMVSKVLERIADLCTNLAEEVIFMATGRIVRHGQTA